MFKLSSTTKIVTGPLPVSGMKRAIATTCWTCYTEKKHFLRNTSVGIYIWNITIRHFPENRGAWVLDRAVGSKPWDCRLKPKLTEVQIWGIKDRSNTWDTIFDREPKHISMAGANWASHWVLRSPGTRGSEPMIVSSSEPNGDGGQGAHHSLLFTVALRALLLFLIHFLTALSAQWNCLGNSQFSLFLVIVFYKVTWEFILNHCCC